MKAGLILTTFREPETVEKVKAELEPLLGEHELLHSEGDPAVAQEQGYDVMVEPSDHLAVWLNRCVRALDVDVYVWLHTDMLFYDGWLENMLRFMQEHPEVWYASPHNWPNPQSPDMWGEEFDNSFWKTRRIPMSPEEAKQYAVDHANEYSVGAGLPAFIRREVFDELGPYDERFVMIGGYEDLDLQRRVFQAGKICATYHGAVAWHRGMGTREPQIQFCMQNRNVFKLKHKILWNRDVSAMPNDPESYSINGMIRI